jgi:NADH:ubiquinone oxidoreductase subunit E
MEGEFLGFIALKYIQVRVGEGVVPIKLAKELRGTLERELTKGDRLSIYLEQDSGKFGKLKLKSDETPRRLKAQGNAHQDSDRIEKLSASGTQMPSSVSSVSSITSQTENKSKGKILVCRKSSCSKRGGKLLYRALLDTLKQLGLQERVNIELTDCQKQCKKAPSLILMPGHVKYAYVHPNNLADLLKAHYL